MENIYIKESTILKMFQKHGVKFILQHKNLVLGDAVGLGKTLQILTAFSYYKTKFRNAKMIILTNKTVVQQFESEVHKFFNGLKTLSIYEFDKEGREAAYDKFVNGDVDILVSNYGSMKMDVTAPTWMKASIGTRSNSVPDATVKTIYGEMVIKNSRVSYKIDLNKVRKKAPGQSTIVDAHNFKDKEGNKLWVKATYTVDGDFHSLQLENQGGGKSDIKTTGKFLHDLKKLSHKKDGLFSVFDEAIVLKDPDSVVHKAGSMLSKLSTKTIAITATVSKGQLEEAYYIFRSIGINLVQDYKTFSKTFCMYKKSPFKIRGRQVDMLVGYQNIQQFSKLIAPHFIGRAKSEVAKELPAFTMKRYVVSEDDETHSALKKIYTDSLMENRPPNTGRLRIALTTPQLIDDTINPKHINNKVQELIRIINNDFNDEKIVVYFDYKSPIDLLETILPEHLPPKYKKILKITGDVNDRASVVKQFNESPNHNLLFINSAAKEGLNLQVSGHLFFMIQPYTAGDYSQIAGRISRIGTLHSNLTIHVIVQNDSSDTDSESIIQIGFKLMKQVSPASVDDGLEQPTLLNPKFRYEDSPEVLLLEGFKSRARKYISKELSF